MYTSGGPGVPSNNWTTVLSLFFSKTTPPRKRSREGQKGGKRDKRLRRAVTRMTEQNFAEATAKVDSSSHKEIQL